MITRDDAKLGELYVENMGDYPPGMTSRDMDHVEGADEVDTDIEWDLYEVDYEINETQRGVIVYASSEDGESTYKTNAIELAPFGNGRFIEVDEENMEEEPSTMV